MTSVCKLMVCVQVDALAFSSFLGGCHPPHSDCVGVTAKLFKKMLQPHHAPMPDKIDERVVREGQFEIGLSCWAACVNVLHQGLARALVDANVAVEFKRSTFCNPKRAHDSLSVVP